MKPIYIAHPFGGEQENVEKVEKIIKGLLHKHPDCTFYSPLHATGFLYDGLDYISGMEHCFEALSRCDELWIAGDWRGKEEIMIKLGQKQYRISYLLQKWFRSQFSKYNPEVNRKCMISKKCKNRWNIIKCGECWRADRFIR